MSLQEAAEARKAKLAALKKRKAAALSGSEPQDQGTAADEANESAPAPCGCVQLSQADWLITPGCSTEAFKFRNYDPETGKARKHARTDEADTVEKQVEGLADQAIAQDEAHRAQELVRPRPSVLPAGDTH